MDYEVAMFFGGPLNNKNFAIQKNAQYWVVVIPEQISMKVYKNFDPSVPIKTKRLIYKRVRDNIFWVDRIEDHCE